MKILHTSDWHVGKVLKGRDRFEEHEAVLRSIIGAARDSDVDLVLIAGDLFETAAPSPKAQGLVMRALLALRDDHRQVVAIAGNHDNAGLLESVYRPVLGQLGLHMLGVPKAPDSGGTLRLTTRGGEQVTVAAMPFLSQRYAVRAAELLLHENAEHARDYARSVGEIIRLLTGQFTPDSVNIVTAHLTLLGGRRGGGEREVQTSFEYEVPASIFPSSAHYAALGHLHRQQEIPAPCPAFYSGSPLAIDFGEEANEPGALIVTAEPGKRADARRVDITGSRRLRTLRGTLDHVIEEGRQQEDAYLRVILAEKARAGLGDLVREQLPNALEVQLDDAHRPRPGEHGGDRPSRAGRSPAQLFGDYLAEQNVADERVERMFAELLEEMTDGHGAGRAG
ncbi:MAG TPA: exonuclease SbcCD subunit D [Streptosporangiaceae bacterium]|nr:exonuclease SbcCD subunit D [Streptosporangiaceae bacterium]